MGQTLTTKSRTRKDGSAKGVAVRKVKTAEKEPQQSNKDAGQAPKKPKVIKK